MPKKLSTNPKATEARERKETIKKEKLATLVKQVEDEKWVDEGSTRYEQKRAIEQAKKQADQEKKQQKKLLARQDEEELDKSLQSQKGNKKVTAHDMYQQQQKSLVQQQKLIDEHNKQKAKIIDQPDIDDGEGAIGNTNQHMRDLEEQKQEQYGSNNVIEATGIDNALTQLGSKLNISSDSIGSDINDDRHPEKRMKAAYKEYETKHMPQLKVEFPGLRLSQLREMCYRNFQKSPANPMRGVKK